ncbi:MAG: arsenate reductase ArsC [Nevskia sp.]|nr:arsenate reductase ArsC [Nevskia sp.]
MSTTPYHVLFLCTGNSARSILAEATLNRLSRDGHFQAYSAGSYPKGQPNPLALQLLQAEGISIAGLRSKSWDEFMAPGAPRIDLVVTVCDAAAGEQCPLYPGKPLKTHWGVPDPHTAEQFRQAYDALRHRIKLFMDLPLDTLDRAALQQRLDEIGHA